MPDGGLQPDTNRLMAHIREFSRRVKLSGTPEELKSFRYLQAELDAYGYRTQLLSHDAFISLPGKAGVEIDGKALPCITHSMSISTPVGGIDAELVHIGEGHEADFSRLDVRGKIVLVDGIATEEVAALASAAGAIGQIHISPNEHLYEMCVSPVWGSPRSIRATSSRRRPSARSHGKMATVFTKRLAGGETIRASIETEVDTGWRKTPILVAELGPDSSAEDAPSSSSPAIMTPGISASWTMAAPMQPCSKRRDCWPPGDRIGSVGCASASGRVTSHGRYSGSAWYADEYFDELDRRCVAHVNVDSTGGEGATVLTNSGVIDELRFVAAEAIEAVSGQKHAGRRHGRAADQSFWGVGIPSMFGSLSHQPLPRSRC